MKKCQRCSSVRDANIGGKCSDMCGYSVGDGDALDGYVPGDMGIGGGDYIEFDFCLDCGQIQGQKRKTAMTDDKQPIGYTLGDDYSKVNDFSRSQPVYEITPEQEALKLRIQENAEALKAIQEEARALANACKHPIWNDTGGFLYYERRCFICDQHIDDI